MPLKAVFISSAWSSLWGTEENCGNEGDLSLGSEALNYSAIPASKHVSSEPWFQQVEGVLLGPLCYNRPNVSTHSQRRLVTISSHHAQNHFVWPCIAVSQPLAPPRPLLPVCSVAMAVVKRHTLWWESKESGQIDLFGPWHLVKLGKSGLSV